MSSWRQLSTSRINQNQSINQIAKIRIENTRMRVQLENAKKQIQPLKEELNKINRELTQNKQKQTRIKNQLIKIGVIANCDQIHKMNDICEFLDVIERKMLQNKERFISMEREIEKKSRNVNENGQNVMERIQNKQRQLQTSLRTCRIREEQIQELRMKNNDILTSYQRMQAELLKKDSILAQLSQKLTQAEIQKKQIQLELKNLRTTNKSETIKKQCQQLLAQVQIKDDDYLKSYLLKNHRFHQTTNSISRKNKYDFIFQ